jgi:hypothetical protein
METRQLLDPPCGSLFSLLPRCYLEVQSSVNIVGFGRQIRSLTQGERRNTKEQYVVELEGNSIRADTSNPKSLTSGVESYLGR